MHIFVLGQRRARLILFILITAFFSNLWGLAAPAIESVACRVATVNRPAAQLSPDLVSERAEVPERGFFILVDLDALTLSLYEDGQVKISYPVSGGSAQSPSPLGVWKICGKAEWGEGFGGAWMSLNVPWGKYGIHGTLQPWYVGRQNMSHGCIRMKNADAVRLMRVVPVGTRVLIKYDGVPGRTLSDGKFGSDVFRLQTALGSLGLYEGPGDGKYGAGTTQAVKNFQKQKGLAVTGKAEPWVYELILKEAQD